MDTNTFFNDGNNSIFAICHFTQFLTETLKGIKKTFLADNYKSLLQSISDLKWISNEQICIHL